MHGGLGVIVGEIYCHQQSIKGNYRKLTANEKGDHKNITEGGGLKWGKSAVVNRVCKGTVEN